MNLVLKKIRNLKKLVIKILRKLLSNNPTIIDIGANKGQTIDFSIEFSQKSKFGF